jgi:hypothetical protein
MSWGEERRISACGWKSLEKEKFGRPKGRWKFKLNLQNVEYMSKVWIDLAQNRHGWRAL